MGITQTKGTKAEQIACSFLKQNGLQRIQRNYHCRYGEIDLIMQDREYTVFVEVRYRKNEDFGGALSSITKSKQRKLRATANNYLQSKKSTDIPCRFDILCLQGTLDQPEIQWLKNAF